MRLSARLFLLVALVFSTLASSADAQWLRRWRNRGSSSSSQLVSSQAARGLPRVNVSYDYDKALADEAEDRVRVFLNVADEKVPATARVAVEVTDLSDTSQTRSVVTPLQVAEGQAEFEVGDLEPEKVYRLKTVIHRPEEEVTPETVIGAVPRYYYVATSSSQMVGRKRRQIVMSAFQYYDNFLTGRVGNMDCWAFCRRHTGKHTRGWNRRTHYGHHVPELAKQGPIFGDYVRIPDYHSLLLLAYDKNKSEVWTIEGNFNSSIVIVQRPVNNSWWVSHVSESNVRPRSAAATPSTTNNSTIQTTRRRVFRRRG